MKRKSSRQRSMILHYMRNMDGHISAEDLYEQINKDGVKVSLSTVYRNLNILSEMHEIKKIAHPINGYLYDKTCKPHHHMHCIKCNRLVDLDLPYQIKVNEQLQKELGIPVIAHEIMLEGICKDCLKKEETMTVK